MNIQEHYQSGAILKIVRRRSLEEWDALAREFNCNCARIMHDERDSSRTRIMALRAERYGFASPLTVARGGDK